MNIQEIMRILPHRYPFLLLDRIVELRPGKMAVGIKNISINGPGFAGHSPGEPIVPGVMRLKPWPGWSAPCWLMNYFRVSWLTWPGWTGYVLSAW